MVNAATGAGLRNGIGEREGDAMREVLRTNDMVTLSFVEATLGGEGIEHFVADRNMSMLEGQIGAFPRRVMVPEDAWQRARDVLAEAGLAHELTTPD